MTFQKETMTQAIRSTSVVQIVHATNANIYTAVKDSAGKKVLTMGKQHLSRDDRLIMKGKLQGTRENMDMIGMVLQDKFGWHVREETPDGHDTMSLEYLFNCLVELTQEINNGYVKRKDIRKTLSEEYKVAFTEGEE